MPPPALAVATTTSLSRVYPRYTTIITSYNAFCGSYDACAAVVVAATGFLSLVVVGAQLGAAHPLPRPVPLTTPAHAHDGLALCHQRSVRSSVVGVGGEGEWRV